MPLQLALRLVEEAASLGQFSSVGFTGGEATLFLDDLLAIGDRLITLKLPFTLATAAQWGTSASDARRTIDALADRGLCRLNISHDPSHEKFVPRDHILNAVRAASARAATGGRARALVDIGAGAAAGPGVAPPAGRRLAGSALLLLCPALASAELAHAPQTEM